jgi:predicted nucleic acid-binding protein
MPDKYILDSSVIAAIFFREQSSTKAVQAVQDKELITVDLARAEVANVAWKRVTIFQEDPEIIKEALKMSMEFIDTICEVIPTSELVEESFQIALKEKVSFYDSLFLGASEKEKAPLITLDKRLKNTSGMVELL